jgi:DMSO/TMAO reductase YedYZ molybdopterin-dependent catalytic subunit
MGAEAEGITLAELQLATRNHGLPLEALRWPVTPTGLHYVLVHYDIPLVDPASFRLEVGGHVAQPLSLTLDDVTARPAVEITTTFECAGNGRARLTPRPVSQPWLLEAVGTARWKGARLGELLDQAGILDGAVDVVFGGLDRGIEGEVEQRYERSLPLREALSTDAVLAYEMNGEPLPPQHGFPLRLVVPGWYGMTNVKWLSSISVVTSPFAGYQQARSYRWRLDEDEEGEPLTRMLPRALMIPPGIPEFLSRERVMSLGPCVLEGRAWSGWGPIVGVEVSLDGGETWHEAQLGEQEEARWSWRAWSYRWEATEPREHVLSCRARDAMGNTQPIEGVWNVGGYANNAVQRLVVRVED